MTPAWLPKGFEFLSGFPDRARRARLIVTVQAFFDESGTPGTHEVMAMAGLMGPAEKVAGFADDWDRHLRANHPGRIRYFKTYEADHLCGEFAHWSKDNRDAKVRQMAKVANNSGLVPVAAAVNLKTFDQFSGLWRGAGRNAMTDPYIQLLIYVLCASSLEAKTRGAQAPIDLIFDQNDIYRSQIVREYDEWYSIEADPKIKAVMPYQPLFRDDKEFIVLQASDLMAGLVRRAGDEWPSPSLYRQLLPKLTKDGHFKVISESELRSMSHWLSKRRTPE